MYLFETDESEVDFQLSNDVITVTCHGYGYNDYSVFYHNKKRSVRGTATELLKAVTNNNLEAVKAFAKRNASAGNDKLTIMHGFVLVSSPWFNINGDSLLDDAEALRRWGIRTTVGFCLKALEYI